MRINKLKWLLNRNSWDFFAFIFPAVSAINLATEDDNKYISQNTDVFLLESRTTEKENHAGTAQTPTQARI